MKGIVNYVKSLYFFLFVAKCNQCTFNIVSVSCVESFSLKASKVRN